MVSILIDRCQQWFRIYTTLEILQMQFILSMNPQRPVALVSQPSDTRFSGLRFGYSHAE
jgi:hypothetical protein